MSATSEGSAEHKQPLSNVVPIAGIIGSLSAILIVITTSARASLDPLLFNFVFAAFSAIILGLVLFGFAWRPLSQRIRARLGESRLESVATVLLPDFSDVLDRFVELASTNYTTGIHRPIQSFQSFQLQPNAAHSPEQLQADGARKYLMQTLFSHYDRSINEPFAQLKSDLARSLKLSPRKFLLCHFAAEFFNLLWTYKTLFVDSYVEACKSVGIQSVPQNSREEYAKFATKFNQFVSSYSEFARKANRTLGERIFGVYIEDAAPLTA